MQNQPDTTTFNIWIKYIHQITSCKKNGRLTTSLGAWIKDPTNIIKIDTWIHQDQSHILILNDDGKINAYQFKSEKYGLHYYSHYTDTNISNINTRIYQPVDIQITASNYIVKL
jgi:hypothetical protein